MDQGQVVYEVGRAEAMGRGRQMKPGMVRIIGGQWRGRCLPVADLPGLRPSGDRGRETLFNWLQAVVPAADCLDLFAGSGALGLEAASRGAGSSVLVDIESKVVRMLVENVRLLDAENVHVDQANALAWLKAAEPASFDLIFVDPPFDSALAQDALDAIAESGVLRAGGFVYLETPRSKPAPLLRPGWSEWRNKVLGEVRMQLLKN
jgi:16S rRNA (guanine966-N2)-methyltransferase